MPQLDRKTLICQQTAPDIRVTGIDFVQVVDHTLQDVLHVFFLIDPLLVDGGAAFPDATPGTIMSDLDRAALSIRAPETGDDVAITNAVWIDVIRNDVTRKVLQLTVSEPGGPELYLLQYDNPAMDRFFGEMIFSFKQGCPSGSDCVPICDCPTPEYQGVEVNYLARDYGSLRAALLDFTAIHYPQWEARIAADPGMMLLEIMAALGDDFAYQQDRFAAEAYLETATQTQSVVNLARLVDYEMDMGAAAATLLTCGVNVATWTTAHGETLAPLPDRAFALREDLGAVPFELTERVWLHPAWNEAPLYLADAGAPCLPIGATEAYVALAQPQIGQLPGGVVFANPEDIWIGRRIVLRSGQTDPANPKRAWAVTITSVSDYDDPLNVGTSISRITFDEALPFEMPIAQAIAYFNAVPAIAGETITEVFRVGTDAEMTVAFPGADANQLRSLLALPRAVEREGGCAQGTRGVVVRYGLTHSADLGVSWKTADGIQRPWLDLTELSPDLLVPDSVGFTQTQTWDFVSSILDADAEDRAFTLEHGLWSEAVRFQKPAGDVVLHDYISNAGFSLRFGDRDFGISPGPGSIFEARTLTAPGADANLPVDAINRLDGPEGSDAVSTVTYADWVTNPFAVNDARPAETLDRIRMNAPEEFRAILLRAVRNEDYRNILERRETIQQANASTRWTGTWLTDFVAVDPIDAQALTADLKAEIAAELDCIRQAGRQVCLRDADYIPLDVFVDVCAEPDASNARLARAITKALMALFDPDNFTFGTPLIRSQIEATVACVRGVRAVETLQIRRRGKADWEPMPARLLVAPHQILQLANDPARPERGFLEIHTHGGG